MPRVVRIHHVAFAHGGDASPHDRFAELLGLSVSHAEEVLGFVERMIPAGDCYLQTLEVTGPGVVATFVGKRGNALHHVALEVDDLDGYVEDLRRRGVRLVDDRARPGGMGTMIAFVHPSVFDGLLVELVQVPGGSP
ncbi:MAG TPA: VOC family protein [Acidimicrobiia bacterium]|nr:VOC family protein [Acidimicrobiia bacterium]